MSYFHRKGTAVNLVLSDGSFTAGKDPISVVLQLMLSGADGGTYDTLPTGCGLGMPESQVDITGMETLRDSLGLHDQLRFVITEPVSAKEWIEENILRAYLLFFVEKLDGTVGLSKLWTQSQAIALGADLAITESILVDGLPVIDTPKPPMGSFKISMDWYPGDGKFYSEVNVTLGDEIEKFGGLARNFEIETKIAYSFGSCNGTPGFRSAAMGLIPSAIQDYIEIIWQRYALNPMPIAKCRVPYNRMTDCQIGNIVTLTSSTLPDMKNSDRGITDAYFQIIEAAPNPDRCTVELTLWMIDVHDENFRQLAPAAKISAYTANNPIAGIDRLDLYSDIFTSADNKDSDAFKDVAAGCYVTLLNSEHEELTPGEYLEVKLVGDDYINIFGPPTAPPGDGDFVTIAPYDSAGAGAIAKWAFGSDATSLLGAADDDPHVRE